MGRADTEEDKAFNGRKETGVTGELINVTCQTFSQKLSVKKALSEDIEMVHSKYKFDTVLEYEGNLRGKKIDHNGGHPPF